MDKAILGDSQQKLASLPSRRQFEKDAERIRKSLLNKFASREHLMKMPYAQKRRVLYDLFSGQDQNGNRLGIFVHKRAEKDKGKRKAFWRFTIHTEFMSEKVIVRSDGLLFSDYLRSKSVRQRYKT